MILTKENRASVDLDFLINQKIESNNVNELLLIVPTNRKARNLKKEIISQIPTRSAFGLNIETLGTISTKLLQQAKPFKQLSEAAAAVFIKQSASETKLRYLSLYKDEIPFGTLDKIKNVISEYKRLGISPGILRDEAEKLEKTERNKALDIADIFESYNKKCKTLVAYEIGDVYSELNALDKKSFGKNFQKLYANVDLIVLNGFSEFSNPEIEIVNMLAGISAAKLFISFDYNINNDYIFSHLDKCFSKLKLTGFKIVDDKSTAVPNEPAYSARSADLPDGKAGAGARQAGRLVNTIREKLFKVKDIKPEKNYYEEIFKIAAHDRETEIELIAREVKKLIVESKAEPHKICIVFNLIQNYSSIIKDVFEKNGLPFNLTDRTPLDNSNPVTAIVNFLEIVENDFYFKNIFRALSSGFVDTSGINAANLYRVSSELKIIAGKENWINSLSDSIANLAHASDDDTNTKHLTYTKALGDIKTISELLKPFEEKLTIEEFNKRLQDFIVKSKLPFKLLEIEIDREKNVRAFTDFIETISEIFDLLKEEFGEEKKFTIDFFMEQIRTACNRARFNVKEKSNYGVLVTTLDEIRGLSFDYLFIGGLCDGDLPTRYNPEIFFSGSFKKQSLIHQTEERYGFYQALCAWNKKLYMSYPATESGRETVVSTFLKDFEEVFLISSKSSADYEDAIFSREELQTFVGRNGIESVKNIISAEAGLDLSNELDVEKISRTLSIDKLRSADPFAESIFTGNILAKDTGDGEESFLSNITGHLKTYSDKQYSISQLETYAKCPFKFFMERVLGIETIEEPTEDIEAIEMGRLLHSILYDFYTTLRDENITLVGADERTFQNAVKLIFEIAEKQLQTTAFKSPLTFYEKEKILGLAGNKKESILYRFLEAERDGDKDFIPKFFEVGFGRLRESESDKILSDTEPIQIDGAKLRGKIDRIEVNEKLSSFNIVDYKLGGIKPTSDDLKNGVSLQLPVYLYAASQLLSKKFGRKYSPNEMFIYSLKYSIGDFGKDKIFAGRKKDEEIQSIEQLIQKSIEHIKNYIGSISNGKFHLSKLEDRENKACRFCQFRTVCRIDDATG